MTRGQRTERLDGTKRARRSWLTRLVAIPLGFVLTSGLAWAYWSAGSEAGGNGASAATTVNQGATPTASAAGRAVTVSWAASTLSNGTTAVAGYIVKRYDVALTPQTILSACTGTVSATTCIESNAPVGTWTYSVTPRFATSWSGAESARSSEVTVEAPTLTLSPTTVKPGTTLTGTAAGFIGGETLIYRLDNPTTGAVLTGSLAGSPTPVAVPGGGGGSAVVTVPSGTSEGPHTVYAVTSPSGETAPFGIVVDDTAPPPPVLTRTPATLSSGFVTFEYTEADASATVECRLDAAVFATCTSPVNYSDLAESPHTFQARATDPAGNVSALTSYTWDVHLDLPTIVIAFPTAAGLYNNIAFDDGCDTAGVGDFCGTAYDLMGISAVNVSLRQSTGGLYWDGTSFDSATEVFLPVTGTASWSYAMAAASFPAQGSYTLRARAADGVGNLGYDSLTFTIDRTAPPPPVLTLTPATLSTGSVTFEFTEADASATVDCSLDGAGFASCTSPVDYSALAEGSHTFEVRATDPAGNVSASTSYTWDVHLDLPTVVIAFPNPAGLYNDSGFDDGCGTASTGDVCGTASDIMGISAVHVSLQRQSTGLYWDGATFSSATEIFLAATGMTSWSYPMAAASYPEDSYTLWVRAADGAGNLGYDARTFTIDRTAPAAPTLTPEPPPTTGPAATFEFTSTDPTAVFECRLDSPTWTFCSSPQTYGTLADGSHTFDVRAVDGAGNVGATTSRTWTVDATAPTAAMTFPTATSYNLAGWTAGCGTPATDDVCGTASDVGSGLTAVEISIRQVSTNSYWNGTTFAVSSETWLGATGTASWSYLFDGAAFPADGDYTVRWRATDAVGNTTTAGVDLTLDTTPPPPPVLTNTPTNNESGDAVSFQYTETDASATLECRLDAGAFAPCASPEDYAGLTAGSHTFQVHATDPAGNISATTSYTWTANTDIPNIAITFPTPAGQYNDSSFKAGCGTPTGDACGTASDAATISAVEVSLRQVSTGLYWNTGGTSFDSATEVFRAATTPTDWTNWTYAINESALPEGDYTLRARVTDGGGNAGYDSRTFTIDRTAPTIGTVSYLNGPTRSATTSVSFTTGTDGGSGIGTRLLQRASATLTGDTCGAFGGFGTVTNGTNPAPSPLIDTVTPGTCYRYQYVVSDNVGNQVTATSTNVLQVSTYFNFINGNAGLLSHWRLGEATTSSDSFAGTAGALLTSRAGEIGANWTRHPVSGTTTAVLTDVGRIRKNANTSGALYFTTTLPASADYMVEADVYTASTLANVAVGVVGRLDPVATTGYSAEYSRAGLRWDLYRTTAGTRVSIGSFAQTLAAGSTYRVALDMNGSTIRLLVDGVQRVSVVDATPIAAAGRAGVILGFTGTTNVANGTGMHLDNFKVTPPLADSKGTNTGDYLNGPALTPTAGTAGAITGDANAAALFDGANDFGTVARPISISDDFSIEFWLKSNQGIGTGAQWYQGAGLVDASVTGINNNDFGVSLRSDGKVVAGVGGPFETSIVSTAGAYNNNAWHHVVFTRTRASGALALYVDGVAAGTAIGSTVALNLPANINFGRIQSGANYYLGALDEVAVYNTVLSGTRVTSHFLAAQ